MQVFVCVTFLWEKIKVGVTLQCFNLQSHYKHHSVQLMIVKSYLLISEHVYSYSAFDCCGINNKNLQVGHHYC